MPRITINNNKQLRVEDFSTLVAFLQLSNSIRSATERAKGREQSRQNRHQQARAWLAQRPRFQVHYTPTYASWLSQVERWFELITQRAIRRGSFSSVKELIAKIKQFVAAYNKTKAPFNWTATPTVSKEVRSV